MSQLKAMYACATFTLISGLYSSILGIHALNTGREIREARASEPYATVERIVEASEHLRPLVFEFQGARKRLAPGSDSNPIYPTTPASKLKPDELPTATQIRDIENLRVELNAYAQRLMSPGLLSSSRTYIAALEKEAATSTLFGFGAALATVAGVGATAMFYKSSRGQRKVLCKLPLDDITRPQ